MRRLIGIGLLALMLIFGSAGAAVAAPIGPGSTETATCDGIGTVHVLINPGDAPRFWGLDAAGNLDGSKGLVGSIDVRVYPGTLTVEPATPPAFAFSKTFGQKKGLGESIHCTFVDTETDETGTFTAFGDVDVFLQG